ncbi:MAG TPA: hypothetical protein VGR16_15440 [Thermomicrobiales bacterium]|nr:hypothetical protein [Thermomicrobiales bacterium]
MRLLRSIHDLGTSLEHYIAQLFMYEFRGHAMWGLSLEGVQNGDVDVVAWLPPTLVYIECKSGLPADIAAAELSQTLRRTLDLAPDLSIVLVDTESDLSPVCSKLASVPSGPSAPLVGQRDFGGVHFGHYEHWPIYVAGAKPSLLSQLRWCLRHFHSHAKRS